MGDADTPQEFADRLRQLADRSGYSVRDLARKTVLSKSTVQDALTGQHFPRLDTVVKIVDVCGGDEEGWRAAWVEVNRAQQHARRRRQKSDNAADGRKEWRQPPPRQLPATVGDFVGRGGELDILTRQLNRSRGEAGAVVITAIGGTAGVGKTALVVSWGNRMRQRFPDGQLYVNLHGYGPDEPRRSGDAVALVLGALGVPAARVPGDEDERAALYRSLLADRKMLVVLDNAVSAEQVRPLLPGSPGCVVVVTSRRELPGLVAGNGALQVVLDRLPTEEAVELLGRILGQDRVHAEPAAAVDIARRCAYLPLALRVAAQRALSSPELSLSEVAGQLASTRDRLDLLATPDNDRSMNVRVVFSWSYDALPADAARLFRLLGLHAGPDFGIHAAAALAGVGTAEATRLLDVLTGAHLAERGADGRYRLHDLLRDYAAGQVAENEAAEDGAAAVRRVLEMYLHAADAADRAFSPSRLRVPLDPTACELPAVDSYQQALDWFELERANLTAATRQAAEAGYDDVAWRIPVAMTVYCYVRKPWDDWITTHEIGLAAAERGREPFGEAAILTGLGAVNYELRQYRAAVAHLERACARWRELGHEWGEAIALNILGSAHRDLRQFEQAVTWFRAALDIWARIDEVWGKGVTLHNLGTTYRELGDADQAIDWLRRSIEVRRAMPDRYGEAWAIHDLGVVHLDLDQLAAAVTHFDQALTIRREIGDRHGEAQSLYEMGKAMRENGDDERGEERLREAFAIFEDLHDPRAGEVQAHLRAS
ncbi:ATP-binding protein [Actinophytocola sp.]|uniref:ATP-binding protein n=1 Tax=Actinophytocola sp. TaxID=1872138 RepID=UPI00389A4B61